MIAQFDSHSFVGSPGSAPGATLNFETVKEIFMYTKLRPQTMAQTIKAVSVGFEGLSLNMTDLRTVRGFTNSFIDSGLRYRPFGVSKREAFKVLADHLLENASPLTRPIIKDEIEAFERCISTPIGELAKIAGMTTEQFLSGQI